MHDLNIEMVCFSHTLPKCGVIVLFPRNAIKTPQARENHSTCSRQPCSKMPKNTNPRDGHRNCAKERLSPEITVSQQFFLPRTQTKKEESGATWELCHPQRFLCPGLLFPSVRKCNAMDFSPLSGGSTPQP